MRRTFSYIVILYLIIGFLLLFSTSIFINYTDSEHPEVNLRYLHHYKYAVFILMSGTALYLLLRSHHKHLSRVEENYYKLFEGSPGAIYVMDKLTFRFLTVNDVMVKKYGYSRTELLKMTALDIRPETERKRLKDYLNSAHDEGRETGIWLHQKRDGALFYMLISHHSIKFKEQEAYIVIAIDVDKSIRNEKRLKEIRWSNSHELRKPLSNIIGLIDILKNGNSTTSPDPDIIDMLSASATELDDIVKKINLNNDDPDN